jgi:hypothetical protein
MAILTVDSLTGCNSIPSFLGGSGDTPANPSIMIFHQTSAPTNWTKVTTWNNTGLRVIGAPNGTPITTGGTLPFTQTFASRSVGPQNTGSSNIIQTQISQATVTHQSATGDSTAISFQPDTLGAANNPPHAHPFFRFQTSPASGTNNIAPTTPVSSINQTAGTTGGDTSPGQSHVHTITAPHTHQISSTAHSHNSNPAALGVHLHAYSGSYDFSITYVDVIIATKN